ncbi:MAG TPA: hypothetical protein VFA33_15690 [Bryobacteraceae bacterium]|nr:hypothetical protein [Bryobacteraceae bacterium]
MAALSPLVPAAPALHAASERAYKHRLAFDVWINDVRNESMPLENWPYGEMDEKTVEGIVRALDVQSQAGYTAIDLAGLLSTYSWPVDIRSVAGKVRVGHVNRIIRAAHERDIKVLCLPAGVMSWGFDEIIAHDPAVRTDNKHLMNPLREESWEWQRKVFDFMIDNFDIDGIHLESADQGRPKTRECLERWPNDVAYHAYVTGRTADYLRKKKPGLQVHAILQGFSQWGRDFTEEEKKILVELSRSVDCMFDQGHGGTYIPESGRRDFIRRLACDYGTSGGLWVYPPQRWERSRWFLPYTIRTGTHIQRLFEDGGRGVLYYQGPVINPGTEVNIAFGGCLMKDPDKSVEETLAEVLEQLYKPRNPAARRTILEVFQKAENVYFDQWDMERIRVARKRGGPGELHLTSLFGASPNASDYLMEPYLTTEGRFAYKQGLISIYRRIAGAQGAFQDGGRIERIKKGIEAVIVDLNNIAISRNETRVWDDRNVNRRF